jgi:hypothetical protein
MDASRLIAGFFHALRTAVLEVVITLWRCVMPEEFIKNVTRFADTASEQQIRARLLELEILRDRLNPGNVRLDCNLAIRILKRELAARKDVDNAVGRLFA